jgi:tetratricopeptide (TPR) repeat protein
MLFDARSARQVAAIGDDAAEDDLPELAQRCAQRIRAQLGVRLPANGYPSFEASAMEPYARGMEHLRQGDALSARAYLEKAAAAAPSNPMVHSGLAAAWSALGLDLRAGQEARLAFDSSAALGRVEQLEIEGRYRAIANNWPRAIEIYRALFTLLPDDLEYGLLLASAETRGGMAQEALGTVNALRGRRSPLGDDPRIDLAEAQAAGALSDYARTRQAARSAAEKAGAHGARLQYAKARLLESGAMQTLAAAGFADVRAEARRICAELGDRACVAAAYRIEGNQMAASGNLAAARSLYQAALEMANQIGNANEKLNTLAGLANAAKLQGDLRAAERYCRAALPVGEEMGPQKSYPVSLDLAGVLAEEGRIAEALALIRQSLQVSRRIGDREGIGLSLGALAHTLALQGRSSDALGSYREALGILREVNEPFHLGETLLEMGNTQLEQGDLPAARKSFEETRTLSHDFPGGFAASEIERAFARLSLAEGHFADAAAHARLALGSFAAAGREGDRIEAAAVLTRALMAQGSIAEASAVMEQVPSPDVRKLPAESVLQFQIARCLVLAHTGRREEAVRAMDVISAEAARSGLPRLAREALQARQAVAKVTRPAP